MKFTIPRVILSLTVTACLLVTTMAFSCSKSQLTASAEDVLSALTQAQPYINQLLPQKAAIFATLIGDAGRLVVAVKASDKTTALQLIADISPVFSDIATSLHGNATVLTILALADIGLHYLANHIPASALASAGPTRMANLSTFKAQRMWGCDYRPDKCK
jgi:hypothetical protein